MIVLDTSPFVRRLERTQILWSGHQRDSSPKPNCNQVSGETSNVKTLWSAFARTCTRNTTLNGLAIEEGTIVLVDLFALHKDQEVWGTNSEEFLPERLFVDRLSTLTRLFSWLLNIDMPKHAYYPFGGGFRMCTGINLAFVELKLALVQILRRFHIFETPNTGVLLCMLQFNLICSGCSCSCQ